jgi:hypothetical protein
VSLKQFERDIETVEQEEEESSDQYEEKEEDHWGGPPSSENSTPQKGDLQRGQLLLRQL